MFGATSIAKNSDKEKYVHYGYGTTFDSAVSWSFNNDTGRNVIILGDNNSSPSHDDNCRNSFLVLREAPTFGINESFGSPNKNFSIFSKANTKCCLCLHYTVDNSYLFVNGKKSLNLKSTIKFLTFKLSFV